MVSGNSDGARHKKQVFAAVDAQVTGGTGRTVCVLSARSGWSFVRLFNREQSPGRRKTDHPSSLEQSRT